MKKKRIGSARIVAMAVAAGWSYKQSKQCVALSDLALANVSDLAQGEIIWGIPCAQVCQNCWCIYFDPYEEVEGQPYS